MVGQIWAMGHCSQNHGLKKNERPAMAVFFFLKCFLPNCIISEQLCSTTENWENTGDY